jgi:hypothetical protein
VIRRAGVFAGLALHLSTYPHAITQISVSIFYQRFNADPAFFSRLFYRLIITTKKPTIAAT